VFDEAENRLHAQKGILLWALEEKEAVLFLKKRTKKLLLIAPGLQFNQVA